MLTVDVILRWLSELTKQFQALAWKLQGQEARLKKLEKKVKELSDE
jgi:hypothetical protein